MPPLNPDQRDVGRRILDALRALAREQRDGRAAGRTRQQYSAAAASTQQQPQFLLHGAAGTGKSHLMGALLQAMRADDLGGAVFSAYTGVAVTATRSTASRSARPTTKTTTPTLWSTTTTCRTPPKTCAKRI